jgi:hypothetical protein
MIYANVKTTGVNTITVGFAAIGDTTSVRVTVVG